MAVVTYLASQSCPTCSAVNPRPPDINSYGQCRECRDLEMSTGTILRRRDDMQQSIWKYSLAIVDEQWLEMPRGATVFHIDTQDGQLAMWVQVDPHQAMESRRFVIYGTWHPMTDRLQVYCGTAVVGELVWHVFELRDVGTGVN